MSAANKLVTKSDTGRRVLRADSGWKFFLGDPSNAEASSFNDASWRSVDLPHDWNIEGPPDAKNATGAGGGYFPAGAMDWKGKPIRIAFDSGGIQYHGLFERPKAGLSSLRLHEFRI
jgi:hypothetical protein